MSKFEAGIFTLCYRNSIKHYGSVGSIAFHFVYFVIIVFHVEIHFIIVKSKNSRFSATRNRWMINKYR